MISSHLPTMIPEHVGQTFFGRSALVTGGTGLIGREVVRRLCDFGSNVRSASLDDIPSDPRAEQVKADLTSLETCKDVTQGMDFVFHIAGIKGSVDITHAQPASILVPLLLMNTSILEAARLNRTARVVYTSTIGAYGAADTLRETNPDLNTAPMDLYPGWAKRMAELQIAAYLHQYETNNFSIVRPSNVYGPGDNFNPQSAMVIPSLMARFADGENPLKVWGNGSAIRDFAFSTDVAEGIILSLYYGTQNSFVNLGGTVCSISELVSTLAELLNIEYQFDETKPSGYPIRVMDSERARNWLGYKPRHDLKTGLSLTWDWYKSNRYEHKKRYDYFSRVPV